MVRVRVSENRTKILVQDGVIPSLIKESTPVNTFLTGPFASGIPFLLESCTRSSYILQPTIGWAEPIYGTATYQFYLH